MDLKEKKLLTEMAAKIRVDILDMLCLSGSGHSGGSLSWLMFLLTFISAAN